jgi:ribonuclease HIII
MAISVRLCSGRTGFEVTTCTKIDLIKASALLKTKVATKHLMLLNYNGVEVSMYPSGRMIIKTAGKEESLEIARRLLAELELLISDEK